MTILMSSVLIACGGGSNNGSTSTGTGGGSGGATGGGAGSGGCVNFPMPTVGQIVKRELRDSSGDLSFSKSTEITAVSNTSITQHITGSNFNSTITEEYTIANNFRDITKDTVGISGFDFVTTYTPFQRVPTGEVCEGQTWTTTYTEKEFGEPAVSKTQTYTIEAVNVSKTTKAGTFNTFRMKLVETSPSVNITAKTWFDIDSGYDVLGEFSDTVSGFDGTLELVEKNF